MGTILIIVLVAIVLWAVMVYNGFISRVNRTNEAWSDIDVQLKRRYDLIPNLVEAVKGYAAHEEGVFSKVTEARAKALSAGTVKEKETADNMVTEALKSVFAVAEAYPDLKASQNFGQLQTELADTENKIQAARRFYNGNVRDLNTAIDSFPGNLIASTFNFGKREFFELENEAERENPKVSF